MAEAKLDTEIRREQIAEAALGLVADQGLRRLSMAAVARRVGLVPSGIYRHFKSKDEILAAVLDRIEAAAAGQRRGGPAGERRSAGVPQGRADAAYPLHSRRPGHPADHLLRRRSRREPATPAACPAVVHAATSDKSARSCAWGNRKGASGRTSTPQTVTMMLFGIVVPAGILWHLTEGGFDVTRHAQRAWQLFSSAITNPAHTPVS